MSVDAEINRARRGHIGRLLLQAHRTFSAQAARRLRERGYAGISLAHIALLPHLDAEGTRASTMATLAGMTKQGMGQLIQELERQGFVRRDPDPADGRAAIVRFTDSGRKLLADAVEVTREIESEFASRLGQKRLAELRSTLAEIVASESDGDSPTR